MPSINLSNIKDELLQKNLLENYWECRESNPGLLGEKRQCYLCAMPPPKSIHLKRLLKEVQLCWHGFKSRLWQKVIEKNPSRAICEVKMDISLWCREKTVLRVCHVVNQILLIKFIP